MRRLFAFLLSFCTFAASAQTCQQISLGVNGSLNGFVPSPADAWHQDISAAPLDPLSAAIISTDPNGFKAYNLHPDFGSTFGIPYNVVDSSVTPLVPVNFVTYGSDSDTNLYPLPPAPAIEGGAPAIPFDPNGTADTADHHLIVLDRNQCVAYEAWRAGQNAAGWVAANGAVWDLTKTEQRPYGLTSVDAAGLSVFAGLLRYDEVAAGHIDHAIRFTARWTKNNQNNGLFTAPASHASGNNWGNNNVIGLRIRLQAGFDISGFSPTNQVILKAMKQYGMILADNGSTGFFQGTADPRWSDDDLNGLKAVPMTAFDVVQMGPVYDANSAPTGAAPVISDFHVSPSTIAPGDPFTFTSTVAGASYSYIDRLGFIRAGTTVAGSDHPTQTTTYTLTARNAFGTSTAKATLTVAAPAPAPPAVPPAVPPAAPPATATTYKPAFACFATDAAGLTTLVWTPVPCTP